jgi:hypothetical protein
LERSSVVCQVQQVWVLARRSFILGPYLVSQWRIVNPDKIKNVVEWVTTPRTMKQVSGFLGSVCYYHQFVPNFSRITKTLTYMTKKDVKFEWTQARKEAFQTSSKGLSQH